MSGAAEGIRVLDFSWVGVGPISTKYLADNGADVVKVESMTRPDGMRSAPPWKDAVPGVNRSQGFASFNSSKRSLALNMATDEARQIVRELVPRFDIVAEAFTPSTMKGWGLGYEDLCRIKPDIIVYSTCMQGQTGPHHHYAGFGNLLAALVGFYHLTGYSESEISPMWGPYTDFVAPRFGIISLLAALEHRRRTGRGQHIDLSQYEAALHFVMPAVTDYAATGRVMHAQANRSERYAPHGAYRCADSEGGERWIAIAVADDAEWGALVETLAAAPPSPHLATTIGRLEHPQELDDYVQAAVGRRRRDELVTALQTAGVAAYGVQNCKDLHEDGNLLAFDFWRWLPQSEVGDMPYDGPSYRLEGTPSNQSAAPSLGEHTDDVLHTELGMTADQIRRLKEEGVLY